MHAVSVEKSVTEFLRRESSVVGIGGIDCEEAPSELGPAEEPLPTETRSVSLAI